VATSDHWGNVTARYAYDPFGKRRSVTGSYDPMGSIVIDWADNLNFRTDRGFIGHEHLDDIGVIHMNGRIFDPTIARFMQGDPFIQDPGNLQNYNRYTYCYNNPLTCTDPSGYFGWADLASAGHRFMMKPTQENVFNLVNTGNYVLDPLGSGTGVGIARTRWGYAISQIVIGVVSIYCGPAYAACVAGGNFALAGAAGATADGAAKTALISGVTAYAFSQVGDATTPRDNWELQYIAAERTTDQQVANVTGHALVGKVPSLA
jgi:RHS repeat-associated protein